MSAPDLRRALAAHTEEEIAEALVELCPRAAVLAVTQALRLATDQRSQATSSTGAKDCEGSL